MPASNTQDTVYLGFDKLIYFRVILCVSTSVAASKRIFSRCLELAWDIVEPGSRKEFE